MKFVLSSVAASVLMTVLACGSSETPGSLDKDEPEPKADAEVTTPDPPDAAQPVDPNAEHCEAQRVRLQEGIDAAHGEDTDVVLAVDDPTCGFRFLTSGPSQHGPEVLHRIGSVTKTYVSGLILSLVAEGKLGLDDLVSTWFDDVPNAETLTVRHLLNNTSGLFNYTSDNTFLVQAMNPAGKVEPEELVEFAFSREVSFAPGEGWEYSNTNFILLGMIAEQVGDAPIATLLRERIFAPIGAQNTFLEGEEELVGTLARGRDPIGRDVTEAYNLSWAWAAGAIVATPRDTLTWVRKLASGEFFDATLQAQLLDTVASDTPAMRYGLGILVLDGAYTDGGGPGIGHNGAIPGFHTQAFYFPDHQTSVVAITNSDSESPNDLTLVAIDVLF